MADTPPRPGLTPGATAADPGEAVTVTKGPAPPNWWGGSASVAPAEILSGKGSTSPQGDATPAVKKTGAGRPAKSPPPQPEIRVRKGRLLANGEPVPTEVVDRIRRSGVEDSIRSAGLIRGAMIKDDLHREMGLPVPNRLDDITGIAVKLAKNVDVLALLSLGDRAAYIDTLIRQTLQGSITEIFASLLSDPQNKKMARAQVRGPRKQTAAENKESAYLIYEAMCVKAWSWIPPTSRSVLTRITAETGIVDKTAERYMSAYPRERKKRPGLPPT